MGFKEMFGFMIILALYISITSPYEYDPNVVNPYTYDSYYDGYEYGSDGEKIELVNNPNATTTTHRNLINFLKSDKTDEIIYEDGVFVCADCAETLHNNAEDAGIKAGWVAIEFELDDERHACNVFEMGDGELVFVDCTNGGYPGDFDTFVEVEYGIPYIPEDINKNSDYYYESLGIIKNYIIYW